VANPFLDWLEEAPELSFMSSLGNFRGQGLNYLQNQYQPWMNRYQGALGQQVRGGQDPTIQWSDFLKQNFNPYRELLRAPQYQTGRGTQNLFSSPRYLYNF